MVILPCMFFILCSFIGKNPEHFLKKQGFVFIPENAADTKSDAGFYILETEVSNSYYKVFLADLKKQGRTLEYADAAVDSAKWQEVLPNYEPYTNQYFQGEIYDDYPVVNITFKGAMLYCKWLTEVYHNEGYNITIMLPDSIQWKSAAKGGNDENIYSWEGDANINNKGFYKCNAKKQEDCNYVTAPIYSFHKNNYGIYNTCGNVAEMLNQEGLHKGGSWNSQLEMVKIDSRDEYAGISGGSPFIGFRPVAIINR